MRLAVAGVVVFALAAAIGLAAVRAARRSGPSSERIAQSWVLKRAAGKRIGRMAAGRSAEAAIGQNEVRDPDSSPDVEAYLLRAYPADEIPMEATIAAQAGWAALLTGPRSPGTWQLIGPSKATVPGVLNVLGDGAEYVTGGRVTAMAIGPRCGPGNCPLYVAAAGGGIWRAPDGLAGSPNWQFVSGSFATNAIGSLLVDPNDASGQTLLAGTGEPNVSGDSEAGLGIYRSTDGGTSWALLAGSAQFKGRAVASLAIAPDGSILAAIARAQRGVSSVLGGATSSPPGAVAFGVYKSSDGGATFANVSTARGSVRGPNEVAVDPNNGSIYYASFFGLGVWRSLDAGATWTQIKDPLNTPPENSIKFTDRSQFALANAGGTTRMYVGVGAAGGPQARFYRADNAQTATKASFVDLTTAQSVNYCEGQCWYDNFVYSPLGYPDVVYLLGSFDYDQDHGRSNGRGVLLSTDGGATWSDLAQDGDPQHAEFTHPDQHAIVVNPNNPFQYWEGSDGGVVRSDGNFADVSSKCDRRGLDPGDTAYCKSLLFRVPQRLDAVNQGFSTLQFQSLSVSPQRPQSNLQGGTQDNGTWQLTGSALVAPQEMYGDGGQSGFSAADDGLRIISFTGQASDVNFRKGDPTKWVVATGAILASSEGSYFYPPVVADPNPAAGGTIFQGSQSVWRTQDWAGNRDDLEANCPEFTTAAANAACGDFVRIGPPGATDLTSAAYGATRRGGAVAVVSRSPAPSNTGTVWVATGTGRVFISDNVDAAASSVAWTRIDDSTASSPGRYPTAIAVDPADPHHAWISYSGYNLNTPATPGHVFEVSWNGATATWTDLDGTSFPDFPATGLALDSVTGDLYVANDFGVLRLANAATTWTVAGSGLPMVEVPGLSIAPGARLLYAATHGRSAWVLRLP
jgi:hypothetical protein